MAKIYVFFTDADFVSNRIPTSREKKADLFSECCNGNLEKDQ